METILVPISMETYIYTAHGTAEFTNNPQQARAMDMKMKTILGSNKD
jgi:hypothetical protein